MVGRSGQDAAGPELILIDTSVWIEYFNLRSPLAARVEKFLESDQAAAITGIIEMEILQGLKTEAAVRDINRFFGTLLYLPSPDRAQCWQAAALYRSLRSHGVTVRSPIDCLLAQLCLKHDICIWHIDRDFNLIAKHSPLKIFDPFQ